MLFLKMEQTKCEEEEQQKLVTALQFFFLKASTAIDGIECGSSIGCSTFEEINQLHNYPIYVE